MTLTFDDGLRSVVREALPVLTANRLPSHLFLTTGFVGATNEWPSQPAGAPVFEMMSWDEVETCLSSGMTIESHTVTHPDLRRLDRAAIEQECEEADEEIGRRLGVVPTLMAYPYGGISEAALQVSRDRYEASFSTTLEYLALRPRDRLWRHRVPRLDTYYLRDPRLYRHLDRLPTRSYVALRALLRRLRGST
ncbi:MAG: polysaccharide deacetylase family protein [Acidobacteriota bacterium]